MPGMKFFTATRAFNFQRRLVHLIRSCLSVRAVAPEYLALRQNGHAASTTLKTFKLDNPESVNHSSLPLVSI